MAKSRKDLAQAAALVAALRESAPFAFADAMADASARGREGWAKPIERSLSQIGAGFP
ncbi:MAG: hypothetical protein Q8S38_08175 [Bosea sp. (in: a-proteobacteria)]|nr:hypothetical protein [Bosea sp. (in: a-proteobacteria)]MDP3408266.1 hypothetical protein [Bosea sp. (in: a-proteobacteria)]